MLFTLPQIEGKIRKFAAIIDAPEEYIPTFGSTNQSGLPHIEINDGKYTVIVCENDIELSRETFENADELVFKVLQDISFSMASDQVLEDTSDQNFRERFLSVQKNIISKIYLYHGDEVKPKQETLITENTKVYNGYLATPECDRRENINDPDNDSCSVLYHECAGCIWQTISCLSHQLR